MSGTERTEQLELFESGGQQVTVSFDGGDVVSDAGLLPIRELDQQLGILAEAARRLPDPRSSLFVTHTAESILTQQVYQILAGYPDGNDAQLLRNDPLFKTIVGKDPRDEDASLASGSTINRFLHSFTRRECEKPMEDGDVIFEVETGMPLGTWHRHGTAHAGLGAVDMIRRSVERMQAHWPNIMIFVRGDSGVAGPEMYDYCERSGLLYAFGFGTNEALKRRVSERELEDNTRLLATITGRREYQTFHVFEDYKAKSWPHARRIVVKVEITKTGGTNIRYVVSRMSGHPGEIYRGFYIQRGNVPERPIGELKNGLQMDRLSSHRFLANGQKMMTHVLTYLLYALFHEANAETPELRKMEVGTARVRLFKVGALVKASHRRIWFKVASHWPGADLLTRAATAVKQHVAELQEVWRGLNLLSDKDRDCRRRAHIQFAPFLLK